MDSVKKAFVSRSYFKVLTDKLEEKRLKNEKRNIFWAVILIFIAVYLVASKMHMIPAIPFFKILFTVIFVYTAVYGFVRLHFFEGMLSVGLLGCMYDKVLGIQAITPWTLLLAACLVGLALDLLFRNLKNKR